MFNHWFSFVMVGTFLCAIGSLLLGMVNLAGPRAEAEQASKAGRSTALMFARVGFCLALLVEIIIYITYFKP